MALRFQVEDDIDREVSKEKRSAPWLPSFFFAFLLALYAAIHALYGWISGESLKSYKQDLIVLIAFSFAAWFIDSLISPVYSEFRTRTKEIYGKVSAIEEAVITAKEDRDEFLERLDAIEEKLESMRGDDGGNEWSEARSVPHRSLRPVVATEADISRAVYAAIEETQATSFVHRGLVMKAARGYLKGKSFNETELQSLVGKIDFLQRVADKPL